MLSIRKNVFETNSSSTHSICITQQRIRNLKVPKKLIFKLGEFGWEDAILNTPEEKASYLYTAICSLKDEKDRKKIINKIYTELWTYGVEAVFCPETSDEYGYIDHVYGLEDFLSKILTNSKRMVRYLFLEESFVHTGNDNDGTDISINVPYKHEEYYKGN